MDEEIELFSDWRSASGGVDSRVSAAIYLRRVITQFAQWNSDNASYCTPGMLFTSRAKRN